MKRTTLFLLGALMASVMPGHGLWAQSVNVNVDVRTLDRAALTSATIYAATPGQLYFVDSAYLMLPWGGAALEVTDNVMVSTPMTISAANGGYTATATVDSTTYGYSFIVAFDANNRCYVLGTSSRQTLDTGYFAPAPLMSQAVDGVSLLLSCPYFEVRRIDVEDTFTLEMPLPHSFIAMMCVGGEAVLQTAGLAPVTLGQVETALIPAAVDRVGMTGPATLLMTTVPTTKD